MNPDTINNPEISKNLEDTRSYNSDMASIINGIWQFLRLPYDLSKDDIWTFVHIRDVADHLLPTVTNSSRINIRLVSFLATDFGKYENHLERVHHISFHEGTIEIPEYSSYCFEVLFRILIRFCAISRRRVADNTLRAMQHHLGG